MSYQIEEYTERRHPSGDAANVGKWIIAPTVLASVLGGMGFLGAAMSYTAQTTGLFYAGMFFFGVGCVGIIMLLLRAITFDKQPAVSITQRTPVPVGVSESPPQRIGGNQPLFVPTQGGARVEHRGQEYRFTPRQLRLMQDRVEDGNYSVARDAFSIEPSQYAMVRNIMAALGYWSNSRNNGSEWTDNGLAWLQDQMRVIDG